MILLLFLIKRIKALTLSTSPDFKTLTVVCTQPGEELYQANVTEYSSRTTLEYVVIGQGVETLGANTFNGYQSLRGADLPYGMTLIKTGAFNGCSKLEYIVLPEKLQTLQDNSFFGCSNLKNITIPSTLTSIPSGYVFYANYNLQKFAILLKNNVFSTTEDGSVLIKNGNIAYAGTCGKKTIRIPDCCTSIASCFLNGIWDSVTGIDFGTSGNLRVINDLAFRQTSISSVVFPEGLEYIYGNPFTISSMSSMSFPATLKCYGNVFDTVPNKVEIAPNCTILNKDENDVIYNADNTSIVLLPNSIETLVIPLTVHEVNLNQLKQMRSLINITAKNHSEFSSYKCVLYNANLSQVRAIPGGLKNVSIHPNCTYITAYNSIVESVYFEGNLIESIPSTAFKNVRTLRSINLVESITIIGYYSFYDSGIEKLSFPKGLKKLISYSFSSSSLTEADFSECINLTEIQTDSFSSCKRLSKIMLPPFVETIGASCFFDCTNLKEIIVPSSTVQLGSSCFSGCTSLMKIEIRSNLIRELPSNGFKECNFSEIKIPDSIVTILQNSFEGNKALKYVNFSENSKLQSIKISAFKECNSIETIKLPKDVSSLSIGALSQMYGLKKIEVDGQNTKFKSHNGVLYDFSETVLNIFPGGIQVFTIEGNIVSIMEKAFYECINLEYLKFNNVKNLKSFGEYTFSGCVKLATIQIPSCVNQISPFCFSNCNSLKTVIFSNNSEIEILSSGIFDQCVQLENIKFGENSRLKNIGDKALSGCKSLRSFEFPKDVERIGVESFKGCINLTVINFNETKIKSIEKGCFSGCINLVQIYLPTTLIDLGSGSFEDCLSIKSIIYCGSEQFTTNAFNQIHIEVDVHIDYKYDKFGGLNVNKIMDKDCMFPSFIFTNNSKQTNEVFFIATILITKDEETYVNK